ncbi:MAG: hypothetical protein C4318_01690 [Acidimicrobiia bacterium]
MLFYQVIKGEAKKEDLMPAATEEGRVVEFWGGPRDGERMQLAEFLEKYPKRIASFPVQGSSLLHVYRADFEADSQRVRYIGELTTEEAASLVDKN